MVYEEMDVQSEEPDQSVIEREDSWHSQESFTCAAAEDPENQDYTSLPLPPLPSPSEDAPPELPVRGHKVNSSIGGMSTGSISIGGKLSTKSEGILNFYVLFDILYLTNNLFGCYHCEL